MLDGRYYTYNELLDIPDIIHFGKNCKIARTVVFDGWISLGDNVMISDFAILTGTITIGSHSHIAHKVHLSGKYGISTGDYFTISQNSIVYTESDTHKGDALIGPQIPDNFRSCYKKQVVFGKFCAVAADCIIMPGSIMESGSMLRLRSNLYGRTLREWQEYGSLTPSADATFIRKRKEDQKEIQSEFEKWYS